MPCIDTRRRSETRCAFFIAVPVGPCLRPAPDCGMTHGGPDNRFFCPVVFPDEIDQTDQTDQIDDFGGADHENSGSIQAQRQGGPGDGRRARNRQVHRHGAGGGGREPRHRLAQDEEPRGRGRGNQESLRRGGPVRGLRHGEGRGHRRAREGGHGEIRPHRHPGEQRRGHLGRPDAEVPPRAMGSDVQRQRPRRLDPDTEGRQRDEGPGRGQHHQHLVHHGLPGLRRDSCTRPCPTTPRRRPSMPSP